MNTEKNIIAIGRSRYLYEGIRHMIACGYSVAAIVTEEAYEEYDIKHADFEALASEVGARFFMIRSVNNEELINLVRQKGVRAAISANWKYTIPKAFLDLFPCGILNFHLGNLPDYKGNATVNWSIINGETHIYGNIHKMDPELDAGDVIVRKPISIGPDSYIADILRQAEMDVPTLYEQAVNKVWDNPDAFEVKGSVHGLRCYPRLPEDSRINWQRPCEEIYRLVRSSSEPYPGAFSYLNEEKITIWKAKPVYPTDRFLAIPGHVVSVNKGEKTIQVACHDGLLEIQEVGKNSERLAPTSFINSIRVRFK